MKNYVAIDIMKLVLNDKAYDIWNQIHHPHEPKIAEIEQLFDRMNEAQRAEAISKVKTLAKFGEMLTEYVNVFEKVANRKVAVPNG
jgi:hypothetical protein